MVITVCPTTSELYVKFDKNTVNTNNTPIVIINVPPKTPVKEQSATLL